MSQGVKDLIKAISEGDASSIDAAFNAEMATRISSRLEDLRVQVAQGMFTNPVAEEVESEEVEEVTEESEEIDEAIVRKDGKLTHADDTDKPIKDSHLAKDVHQTKLAKHLGKDAYFDDVDLVHGEKTVMRNAIHPKYNHTVGDLATALRKHTSSVKEESEHGQDKVHNKDAHQTKYGSDKHHDLKGKAHEILLAKHSNKTKSDKHGQDKVHKEEFDQ